MKKLDILLLGLFPALAVSLSLIFRLNYLASSVLFFGLPAAYLTFRTPHVFLRTTVFALLFALVTGIVGDHIALLENAWFVPTLAPFRIFGVAIEELIWYTMLIYLIIIFYEHFMDKGKHVIIDKHMKKFAIILLTIFVTFVVLFLFNPEALNIRYFYLRVGIVVGLPILFIIFSHPHFLIKLLKITPYLIILSMLNLLTAVELGHWYYTGINFVGWVNVLDYRIPLEELIYFVSLFSTVVIGYFEFFDDRKHLVKM